MTDDLDRYRQLLSDWKVSDRQPKRSARTAEPPPPPREPDPQTESGVRRAKLARSAVQEAPEERFPKGTILSIDDEELAIYRRPVAGKENFDMVYSLLADGLVKIDGVNLGEHDIVELGILPPADLKVLQSDMRWGRNLIAPNCYSPEDGERIPDPFGSDAAPEAEPEPAPPSEAGSNHVDPAEAPERVAPTPTPPPPPPKKKTVRRGVRLKINFGDRFWDAVYWGKDKKGTVVAHKTHGRWTLMHLDLNRFKETMDTSGQPDPKLIKEITGSLLAAKKS